jgi:hypothetical protein
VKDIRQVAKRRPADGGGWWWNRRAHPSAARRVTKAWGLLAIAGLLAALAAACGGGGEPQAEGSPTLPPTTGEAALAPCQALQALKAYRYSVDLKLESPEPTETPVEPRPTPTTTHWRQFNGPFSFEYAIEASFVAPDRFESVMTANAGEPVVMIIIGTQTWLQTEGKWTPIGQTTETPYTPPIVCEALLPDLDLSQIEPQKEKINDVNSLHYTFPQVHSEQAWAKIYGPGSDLDIVLKTLDVDLWLAEKGNWPVRMDIRSSGLYADGRELRAHILVDIRDANSGDIRVEPPS